MKKIILAILLSLIWTLLPGKALAAADITIVIDGKAVAFTKDTGMPFVDENARTLVPFRQVLESFGARVSWDSDTRTALATYGGKKVGVPIGSAMLHTDTDTLRLDTKAIIRNGRTYLPVRAVMEGFDAQVEWDGDTRSVMIQRDGRSEATYKGVADYTLGMSKTTVQNRYGAPNKVLASSYGFDWWVYRNGYDGYIQLGVDEAALRGLLITAPKTAGPYKAKVGMSKEALAKLRDEKDMTAINDPFTSFNLTLQQTTLDGVHTLIPYMDDVTGTVQSLLVLEEGYGRLGAGSEAVDERLIQSFEQQIFELTNVFRVQQGQKALVWHEATSAVAKAHSKHMAVEDYFDHTSPGGEGPGERLERGGIRYRGYGENIAAGQRHAMEAVNGWVNSPGHRANMLQDYFEAHGAGVYAGGGTYGIYYTQVFLTE